MGCSSSEQTGRKEAGSRAHHPDELGGRGPRLQKAAKLRRGPGRIHLQPGQGKLCSSLPQGPRRDGGSGGGKPLQAARDRQKPKPWQEDAQRQRHAACPDRCVLSHNTGTSCQTAASQHSFFTRAPAEEGRVRLQRREGRDRDLDPVPLSHSHQWGLGFRV